MDAKKGAGVNSGHSPKHSPPYAVEKAFTQANSTAHITFGTHRICDRCHGQGWVGKDQALMKTCPRCSGYGTLTPQPKNPIQPLREK